jgi:hypothetical protein
MKKAAVIQLVLLLLSTTLPISDCPASNGNTGTSSAQFLKLGFGGRALAMGGAFVGLADDVTALFWNPAGLADLDRPELCYMHRSLFQDVSLEYAAYAQSIEWMGVVGGSIACLHMDQLTGRDEFGEFTSDFTSNDIAVTIGYALRTKSNISFGAGIKYVEERIEVYGAHALAFDIGWLYRTPLGKLRLGGAIQNLGQDIKFVSESYELPRLLRVGAAYSDSLGVNPINAALDIFIPSDNKKSLRLGGEYVYRNLIAARMGYNGSSELGSGSRMSFGIGLMATMIYSYRLDYCYLPQGALGDSHTISLLVRF